jgi:hypothetical protein
MSEHNQSRNSKQNPPSPPENLASSEATTGESSVCADDDHFSFHSDINSDISFIKGRRRGKIRRFLGKVKNATKKISVS